MNTPRTKEPPPSRRRPDWKEEFLQSVRNAALQSQVWMGEPAKPFGIRVFVDVDRSPCEVVTAYRTSQIAKYWRQEP